MSNTDIKRKYFVSYKYADKYVRQNSNFDYSHWLSETENGNYLTARDYVDHLIKNVEGIYKGEYDGEDLSYLSDEQIKQKLYDRIFDSSVTIVLITKGMVENKEQKDQWIPLEIRYSLTEKTREENTSLTNGMIAVAIPDENNSYAYFVNDLSCGVRSWNTAFTFPIIHKNMFNKKEPNVSNCHLGICGGHHSGGDHSYIHPVKWDDFIADPNKYIEHVVSLKDKVDEFVLMKEF